MKEINYDNVLMGLKHIPYLNARLEKRIDCVDQIFHIIRLTDDDMVDLEVFCSNSYNKNDLKNEQDIRDIIKKQIKSHIETLKIILEEEFGD